MKSSTPINPPIWTWPLMAGSLSGLILLCVVWETWLAPFKPGSFLLSLKILPLVLPLVGVFRRNIYTLQWSSMLIWLYFIEGVVRGFRNPDHTTSVLAWLEVLLVVLYFLAVILYLRPLKQAAKQAAKLATQQTANQQSHAASPPANESAS